MAGSDLNDWNLECFEVSFTRISDLGAGMPWRLMGDPLGLSRAPENLHVASPCGWDFSQHGGWFSKREGCWRKWPESIYSLLFETVLTLPRFRGRGQGWKVCDYLKNCFKLFYFLFCWSLYWICYSLTSGLCFGFWPQGMWDLSLFRSGVEPVPHVVEGEILTTGPPGKSLGYF